MQKLLALVIQTKDNSKQQGHLVRAVVVALTYDTMTQTALSRHGSNIVACRGVHFALSDDDRANLLGAVGDDDAVLYVIQEEIEEEWDRDWLCETDKAWDAIHRCLADGTLAYDDSTPLHWCVLNGTRLYDGDDYIISLVEPDRVPTVASAVATIDRAELRSRYDAIDPSDYGMPLSDEDFEYTWENFSDLRTLFQKAAAAGRAVVFTVDQ